MRIEIERRAIDRPAMEDQPLWPNGPRCEIPGQRVRYQLVIARDVEDRPLPADDPRRGINERIIAAAQARSARSEATR